MSRLAGRRCHSQAPAVAMPADSATAMAIESGMERSPVMTSSSSTSSSGSTTVAKVTSTA